MMPPREFLSTPTGQLVLVGLLAAVAGGAVYWRQSHRPAPVAATAVRAVAPASTPRTFVREGAPFPKPPAELPAVLPKSEPTTNRPASTHPVESKPAVLPLSLSTFKATDEEPAVMAAPYGRLIPCETVLALESNRLETPVIGLVTEDVWHDGQLIVPAGAEVHGRASTDRARERLAAQGAWTIVWRTPGADNDTELSVQGIALDRERDPVTGVWGEHDGSAGLRGEVLKTNDWHAVELFAATFLSTATLALQDTRTTAGVLGETVSPTATTRNAALAGTSAVLREYASQIREAIERDGIYVRVPAGKPFYLYVTQKLDRGRRAPRTDHAN